MPARLLHIQWHTFGTWLPGDARGFRSRDHRIHSSGDYKSPPPPEEHAGLRLYAARTAHRGEVVLDGVLRQRVLDAIVAKAMDAEIDLLCAAVGAVHVHALVVLDEECVGREVGRLKRHSSHAVRDAIPGTVWGAGQHTRHVDDEEYRAEVRAYIMDHARKEGAAVWRRAEA